MHAQAPCFPYQRQQVRHPGVDPLTVNFVDLRDWVLALRDFEDDPARCGERILEAIQAGSKKQRLIPCSMLVTLNLG